MRGAFALATAVGVCVLALTHARAADPVTYTIAIDNAGSSELNAALTSTSLLATLREKAPAGAFALVTRAKEDQERLLTTLHAFGYYAAKVNITIAGRTLDDAGLLQSLDALPNAQSVPVHAALVMGPLYTIRYLEVDGTGDEDSEAQLGLITGRPAIASQILESSSRLLAALQEEGYALAKVDPPIAYADDAAHAMDVLVKATPGPKVEIGAIALNGLKDVHEGVVRDTLDVKPGDPYRPSRIEETRKALLSLGVFGGVGVHAADALDSEGRMPIAFELAERPMHAIAFSAAYSTDLGFSASASWTHRNLFGNAEQLILSAAGNGIAGTSTDGLGYDAHVQFIKPMFLARNQTLDLKVGALKQSLDAYDQTVQSAGGFLKRKFSDLWRGSVGVTFEHDQVEQQGVATTYDLVSLPFAVTYDSTGTDTLIEEPLRGVRGAFSVTGTQPVNHTSPFTTLQISGSGYIDASNWFDEKPGRSVLALRGLIATVLGTKSTFDLPPDRRLYVGGSGTVRGYEYQSIGPLFPNGDPVGATSADSASVEWRQRLGEDWGFAVFADAGQASDTRVPFNGDVKVGVGAGVRYYTSIGAIRADLAMPLAKPPKGDAFEVYIGLGQAF